MILPNDFWSEFAAPVLKVPPINELLFNPPEGNVKAIASTILSIYYA